MHDLLGQKHQGCVLVRALQQALGQLADGLRPPPLLPTALIEACVLDREAGGPGQRHQHGLVGLRELLLAQTLSEIEVAEDLVPDPYRSTHKACHRRMVRREPDRLGVRSDVGQPPWTRVSDQKAENAVPGGMIPDPLALLVAHTMGDELHEMLTVRTKDAESPVARIDQGARGSHDPTQDLGELEVLADGGHRVEQPLELDLRSLRRIRPGP